MRYISVLIQGPHVLPLAVYSFDMFLLALALAAC